MAYRAADEQRRQHRKDDRKRLDREMPVLVCRLHFLSPPLPPTGECQQVMGETS
jgi:hypothetical protein